MDNKVTQEIRKLFAEIAKQELDKIIPNVEMVYDGVVDYFTTTDADGNEVQDEKRLVVRVKGEQYDIQSTDDNDGVFIRNPHSVVLKHGTAVRVNAKGGNLHNAYINIGYERQ